MFENRRRGRDLAIITSYGYVVMGILLLAVALALNSDMGIAALAQKGVGISDLFFGVLLYFVFAIVIYLLSTKYENDEVLWKLYIVIAILNIVVIGFSIILLVFSVLLIISGNDIREELI